MMHPDIFEKLMKQIRPPLDALNGNILEGFTQEMTTEFDYLHQCYSEALRHGPPIVVSAPAVFTRDVSLGPNKVVFPAGLDFQLQVDALHSDPAQWIEPTKFEPERFNLSSESKWTKAADGKPRNPLSFTPFYGGKRICLGKNFAQTSTQFTIPILFHYMNLSPVEPEF